MVGLTADDPGIAAGIITIPNTAKELLFPCNITQVGDGGELVVYFDDQVVWSQSLANIADLDAGFLDVSQFAGIEGLHIFELISHDGTIVSAMVPEEVFFSDESAAASPLRWPSRQQLRAVVGSARAFEVRHLGPGA